MNNKAKELIKKAQFRQQKLSCMIISELGIKEIIKKYQNGETLSKRDCNALLKFKDRTTELLSNAYKLKMDARGTMAFPSLMECGYMYIMSVLATTCIGTVCGYVLSEYKKHKFMSNQEATLQHLMDITNTSNIDSLDNYLNANKSNLDYTGAYDTFSQIMNTANDVSTNVFNYSMIFALMVGIAIPTIMLGYSPVSQALANAVDTYNDKIDNIKINYEKTTEILTKNETTLVIK